MAQVFVSYSRVDQRWVDELAGSLEAAGIDVWVDRRELPVSLPWLAEVQDAIEGSALFVACDSESFRKSTNCSTERALAQQAQVRQFDVEVDGSVDAAASRAIEELARVPLDTRLQVEARVRAREWDRRGRGRKGLVTGRTLRSLREACGSQSEPLVQRFLAASRRRVWRQRALLALGGYLVLLSLGLNEAFGRVGDEREANTDQLVARLISQQALTERIDTDIYSALGEASGLGATEAALDGISLAALWRRPPPDRAVQHELGDLGFAEVFVHTQPRLVDVGGNHYVLEGDRLMPAPSETALSNTLPVVEASGATITVRGGDGALIRRLVLPFIPKTVRISPDGRELASVTGQMIVITDIETGIEQIRLTGSPSQLTDVAWSDDGRAVWGVSDSWLLGWTRRHGRRLIDDSAIPLRGLTRALNDSTLWVLGEPSWLLEVDTETGGIVDRFELDAKVYAIDSTPLGGVVVVGIESGIVIVDASDRSTTYVDLGCLVNSLAVASEEQAFVRCDNDLLTADLATAATTNLGEVPYDVGPEAIAWDAPNDRLLLGSLWGQLVAYDGEFTTLPQSGTFDGSCPMHVRALDVGATTGVVAHAGERSGQLYCGGHFRPSGGGYEFVTSLAQSNHGARAMAIRLVAGDTVIATGFTDGTVVFGPQKGVTPLVEYTEVSGDVFAVLEIGDELFVATRAGLLHALPVPDASLSNASLAEALDNRLQKARDLGLVGG
ncbi:MAG: TIR domain-containing protein [Acidimicrobiia bacterium]|nr:TIR domain-containing protein [Acidimicrobiia bacterium]